MKIDGGCPSGAISDEAEFAGAAPQFARLGGLRKRDALAPRKQVWFHSALAWLAGLADLPHTDKS